MGELIQFAEWRALRDEASRRGVAARGPDAPAAGEYNERYGPGLCPGCLGTGWLVARVDAAPGELRPCPRCGTAAAAALRRCWVLSGLDPAAPGAPTLDAFQVYDAATQAMALAAWAFVARPRGWLVCYGQARDLSMARGHTGAGKTHLAEAVARELLGAGVPALSMTASRLFEYVGAAWRPEGDETDYGARLRWVMHLPVLILDEVGGESATSDAVRRLRYDLLDARYRDALASGCAERVGATMLVSNLHPDAWADERITSRAMDERWVRLEATPVDYRRLKRGGGS